MRSFNTAKPIKPEIAIGISDFKEIENFYHAFSLGLIVHLSDFWQIKSNRESGYGRSEILMSPLNPNEYFGVGMEQ